INGQQCFSGDDRVAALLAWQKKNGLNRSKSNLLLPPADYQILQIDAPAVDAAELKSATRWQVKDFIDFPVDDAAVDCMPVPTKPGDNAAPKLLTVVSRKAVVGTWMKHWHAEKLTLNCIDIPEMALRNLAVMAAGAEAAVFLHLGWETTNLLIVWQESLCTFRQLNIGAAQLVDLDDFERAELIGRIALELQRTTDAFGRQFFAANLNCIYVSSVMDPVGIATSLNGQMDFAIEPFVLSDWVTIEEELREEDLDLRLDYTLAIGAALRGEVS
ncbi:MAG: hypothetical protein V4532_15170, partial [Pseudomonadota bacterium]